MTIRSSPQRPLEGSLLRRDGVLVNRRMPVLHQPVRVEFPILIPIGSEPGAAIVVMLVCEPHSDPVSGKRPELLDQTVFELLRPFPGEERFDCRTTDDELRAVPPMAVDGIGQGDL